MWKPRIYPYAKVLIANPNNWERRLARECLMMMKVTSIFETDNNKDLGEAFWNGIRPNLQTFGDVVEMARIEPLNRLVGDILKKQARPGAGGAPRQQTLRAADALAPYIDRVMLCVPTANLRTLGIAQALKINILVLKPYSIHTFCTHAHDILSRKMGSLAQIKPIMPRRQPVPELELENSFVALNL